MNIDNIIWKDEFVKKIETKHHVTINEVEEIIYGKKKVHRIKSRIKSSHS